MKILAHIVIVALSLLLAAYVVPGVVVPNIKIALIAAIVLGLLNFFIRPILIILTIPINILTLGLFTFVVNSIIFMLAASLVTGFVVKGFWSACLGSLVVSMVSTFASKILLSE